MRARRPGVFFMSPVPVTFLFDFEQIGSSLRPYVMHEFAANGAKNLVLSGPLIAQIMQDEQYTELKEYLELDRFSQVLMFSTEGNTDPEDYNRIVGER